MVTENTTDELIALPPADETSEAIQAPDIQDAHPTEDTTLSDDLTTVQDGEGNVEGNETPPEKTPEQLKEENDKKAMAGKISALEKRESEARRNLALIEETDQLIDKLYSAEGKFDAIAQLALDQQKYERVRKYVPEFRTVDYAEFVNQVQQLQPDQKAVIEEKKKLTQVQNQAREDIEIERIKARQQAAMEYRIPLYGQLAQANPTLAKQQYDTALSLAYTKATFLSQSGQEVVPQTFETMVESELVSLNPSYQKIGGGKAPATQAIGQMVNGVAVNSPIKSTKQLSPEDQALYSDLMESFKGVVDEKTAHQQAMNIINS